MGRLINGINGAISGGVGPVVFVTLKNGKCFARAMPKRRKGKRTENEKAQTNKMSLISPLINHYGTDFIRIGFEQKAMSLGQNAANTARSINLKSGVKGKSPNQEVDWENFKFTCGDLAIPQQVVVVPVSGGFEFTWGKDFEVTAGNMLDRTMIMLYNEEINRHFYIFSGAQRREGKDFFALSLPKQFRNIKFRIYLSFKEVTSNRVSDSVYCGEYSVAMG